jgi:hypothetical protein
MTAMINMHNAATFLEQGKYVPPDVSAPKPSSAQIMRTAAKPAGVRVPYLITDKPPDKKARSTPIVMPSRDSSVFCTLAIDGQLDGCITPGLQGKAQIAVGTRCVDVG